MCLPVLSVKRKQRGVKFVKYGTQFLFAKKKANNITADVMGGISITHNERVNVIHLYRLFGKINTIKLITLYPQGNKKITII